MSAAPRYELNRALAAEIGVHLRRCDAEFRPPLSARVDIAAYASKLAARAERIEAWDEAELVGLLAVYCNDPNGDAFISSVSVVPEHSGLGIGKELIRRCIAHCTERRARRIGLTVDPGQHAAIRLYEKSGFAAQASPGPALRMEMLLEND